MKKKKPNNASSRQRDFVKALERDLKKAKKAMKLADEVMDYCGDKWERAATQSRREEFSKLYKEIFGEDSKS